MRKRGRTPPLAALQQTGITLLQILLTGDKVNHY